MAEIIFALDYQTLEDARRMVDALKPDIKFFKIGLQLFTACGPDAVRMALDKGCDVFLDLKLHDIPNTMEGAVRSAASLGCRSMTVHIASGVPALVQAKKGQLNGKPRIWGVTILSSLGSGTGIELARAASEAGLEGVIASGEGVAPIREKYPELEITVPGIRPSWSQSDDQRRVLTPAEAVQAGADYLVIGRPIGRSDDPRGAAAKIKEELGE